MTAQASHSVRKLASSHFTHSGSWGRGSGESCLQDKAPDLKSALTCFTHKFELYDLGHLW